MKNKSAFWNRLSKHYYKSPVRNLQNYNSKLDQISQLIRPESSILELGCGTGSTALKLSSKAYSYTAYDFSEEMIKIANRRLGNEKHKVEFILKDIETLSLPYKHYDMVMAHSVLHLLENAEDVLESMLNAVNYNGYIVLNLILLKDIPFPLKALLSFAQVLRLAPYLEYQNEVNFIKIIRAKNFKVMRFWKLDKTSIFVIAQRRESYNV